MTQEYNSIISFTEWNLRNETNFCWIVLQTQNGKLHKMVYLLLSENSSAIVNQKQVVIISSE